MNRFLLLIAAVMLACGGARAADIAPSYAVPGFPSQRTQAFVILCPSSDGSTSTVVCSFSGGGSVTIAPSTSSAAGIIPTVSTTAESSHILKSSPGNVYGVYATNLTSTAGFLLLFNAATVPADGAVTPAGCVPIAASSYVSINYNPGPPGYFNTGIVAVLSSGATCFTKTTGAITGFISGSVQ